MSLETGLQIMISRFASGKISLPSNDNTIVIIEDSNVFRKKLTSAFLFRARFHYALNDTWNIYGRVGSSKALGSWYNDSDHELKPVILGLELGVKKNF